MASHALLAGGKVWLVDPNEGAGVEERARTLGEPRACCSCSTATTGPAQRSRSSSTFRTTASRSSQVGPFETVAVVQRKRWQEVALWWPQRRVLVCADALGTVHIRSRSAASGSAFTRSCA